MGFLILGIVVVVATLFLFFVYAPAPKEPVLTATMQKHTLEFGNKPRTYYSYRPATAIPNPPLLIVLHGTNIDGAKIREWTGYEFDQMADKYGFLVAYPDGYDKDWNDCRKGDFSKTKKEKVDDVGFIKVIINEHKVKFGINPAKVYLFGYSSGGNMAIRTGIQEVGLIAGIVTVCSALPPAETCNCDLNSPTPDIMLINGTGDGICPYTGGALKLFGRQLGFAISAQATAENFVKRNGITGGPDKTRLPHLNTNDKTSVERQVWGANGTPKVELWTVNGGGHVVPQPVADFPRILGKKTGDLDAPKEAVAFFGLRH